jgi:hypothetical protein
MNLRSSVVVCLVSLLVGCATADVTEKGSSDVRSITRAEALEDFDQIAASFRGLYGALERKEQRYGFRFEEMVTAYRSRVVAATTEAEWRGIFQEFLALFKDPHVSLSGGLPADDLHSFRLPFATMPVGDTFVVYTVDAALGASPPIQRGDEVLTIDGRPAKDLVASYLKYVSIANPLAALHSAAARLTSRAAYLSTGLSPDAPASVRVRGADGAVRDVALSWKEIPHLLPPVAAVPLAGESGPGALAGVSLTAEELTTAEMGKSGSRVPFFMTDAGRASLASAREVKPGEAALTKFGLTAESAARVEYFALTYALGKQKVLLVRIPSYTPSDEGAALNWLRALLDEQKDQVDALVVDETHNPGGSISFAEGVVSILAKDRYRGYVQRMHGDRKWIQSFASTADRLRQQDPTSAAAQIYEDRARMVDAAYGSGGGLTEPVPFFGVSPWREPDPAHWTKPVVMLADELSVSCADFVPLVARANGMVTLFGQTTMGGGGNVERVATLTNTQTTLSISRGVGTVFDASGAYPEADVIEDNGVSPDVAYGHTLADFRAGYVGYIGAFNSVVARILRSERAEAAR